MGTYRLRTASPSATVCLRGRSVHATDRQRLEHSADALQHLVRRARSLLFFSLITVLILLVLLAYATAPDAAILGINTAEDGDDACFDEVLPPTSTPPLRATDAGTLHLGDCWSARVARTLMSLRDRAPPAECATGHITIVAPPSMPLDALYPPARVATHPVGAPITKSLRQFGRSGSGAR